MLKNSVYYIMKLYFVLKKFFFDDEDKESIDLV